MRHMRKIIRKINKNSTLSASQLTSALLKDGGMQVIPQIIQNFLIEAGYNERVGRKMPYVNEKNRKK